MEITAPTWKAISVKKPNNCYRMTENLTPVLGSPTFAEGDKARE
jgi:hypothetical protein